MKPGIYRLTKDITNPRPDRRHQHDWRKAVSWKAGQLFAISTEDVEASRGVVITIATIHAVPGSYSNRDNIKRAPQLVEALEPVESKTVADVFREATEVGIAFHSDSLRILQKLVDTGRVTLDEIAEELNRRSEQ